MIIAFLFEYSWVLITSVIGTLVASILMMSVVNQVENYLNQKEILDEIEI